tara:strand:- start:612 stop:1292 length:681 start_codon:yes stop_codon:yes gene_type:complete
VNNSKMIKLEFLFDEEKDLWNIWDSCNHDSRWNDFKKNINAKILKICVGKEFKDCKEELREYMQKFYNSKIIEIFLESLKKSWKKINGDFFDRIKKVTKNDFPFDEVKVYITTSGRSPYNWKEPSFMVSVFYSLPHALNTCGHELLHIQFHNTYWEQIEEKIGKEKTADLKEALTILLNLEFKDLWFAKDKGYECHKELREFIKKTWEEKKDFGILLEKCVKYLKE